MVWILHALVSNCDEAGFLDNQREITYYLALFPDMGGGGGISDTDGDGLSDLEEVDSYGQLGSGFGINYLIGFGTNPLSVDSDSDGLTDGQGVRFFLVTSIPLCTHPTTRKIAPRD